MMDDDDDDDDDDDEWEKKKKKKKNILVERGKTDLNQEYRRWSVPRILRTCRFNKEKEEEKHYRELLILYTVWRQEEDDLIGMATSYKNRYFEIRYIVEGHLQMDNSATEPYDIGQDLGLPA